MKITNYFQKTVGYPNLNTAFVTVASKSVQRTWSVFWCGLVRICIYYVQQYVRISNSVRIVFRLIYRTVFSISIRSVKRTEPLVFERYGTDMATNSDAPLYFLGLIKFLLNSESRILVNKINKSAVNLLNFFFRPSSHLILIYLLV